jgi:hypothetical protein
MLRISNQLISLFPHHAPNGVINKLINFFLISAVHIQSVKVSSYLTNLSLPVPDSERQQSVNQLFFLAPLG